MQLAQWSAPAAVKVCLVCDNLLVESAHKCQQETKVTFLVMKNVEKSGFLADHLCWLLLVVMPGCAVLVLLM